MTTLKKKYNSKIDSKYIINNFNKKLIFKGINDTNFLNFMYNGIKPQTEMQKRFAAEYFDMLLVKKIKYLKNIVKQPHDKCIYKIIEIIKDYDFFGDNFLEKKINYKSNDIITFKKQIDNIIKHFSFCKTLNINDEELINMLKSIKNTFFDIELGLPQYHFYTGIIGYSHSFGKSEIVNVNINNVLLLHSLNKSKTYEKILIRENAFIELFHICVKDLGENLSRFTLDFLIEKYILNIKNSPIFSSSQLLSISYPRINGTYNKDFYILIEGNGRLCAIKSACYKIKKIYHNFNPPTLTINNSKINSKVGIKNQFYFLLLLWENLFPNNKISGFKNQLTNGGLFKINKKNLNPFLYGFVEENIHIPTLNIYFPKLKKTRYQNNLNN